MDNRAVSAVIEKVVAIGLVTLFVSGFGVALFGGVVPDYRASAADELADRSLAAMSGGVEATIPASRATLNASRTVVVPETIGGATYRFELANRTLHLRHPEPTIGTNTRVAIPADISPQNASVPAGAVRITVNGPPGNRTLEVAAD